MACDCSDTILKKVEEFVLPQLKNEIGFKEIKNVFFTDGLYVLEKNKFKASPIMVRFSVEYVRTVKKTGVDKVYTYKSSIRPSFCPFCGKEYKEEKCQTMK